MKKITLYILSFFALIVPNACEQEFTNPSSGNEEVALRDVAGLIAVANGLQYRYTIGRQSPGYTIIVASGLTTKELRVLNAGNTDEVLLEQGAANVVGGNGIVTNLWGQLQVLRSDADRVLTNATNIGDLGTRSGLIAFASIYKALALGTLAQFWERSPLTNGEGVQFSTREELLREAVRILESANAAITANPISAAFTSRIVVGLNIPNTINALIARYSLMLNDNDKALEAAGKVSLTVLNRSEFRFDDLARNPIWDVALGNVNVVQPVNLNMGLPDALKPVTADKRIDFYFVSRTPSATGVFRGKGFFTANNSPMPVYLPGEMLLIRAEAFARKDDLTNAIAELNKVLTKKPADDAWGVGADLPAYSGAETKEDVLTEIYRQRCIELFMSGLKLEDNRRFGRPAPPANVTERNRNFYPFPFTERDNNPQTPADPAI